jgi:hypothetical protein
LTLDKVAESRWVTAQSETEKEKIEEVMSYVLCEFAAGLRGEEVPMISMSGLLTYWGETAMADRPHVMLTLQGRFKGETNERWHCVPIVDVTNSGIQIRKWLHRLVIDRRVNKQHQRQGWMFRRRDGTKGKLSDYDPLFRDLIGEVKETTTGLISEATQVDDFSLWRSGRRGSTTETTNKGGLPMRQVYTAIKHAVPAMLEYSGAL